MSEPVDVSLAPHYKWGGSNDGWHLLKRPDLSVIEERVLPGGAERRHLHRSARQFFYVLRGEAVLEVNGVVHLVRAGQGLEVEPGIPHQFRNESAADVSFLVVSAPPSHGDRVDL